MKGNLIIICSPSGGGKGTIIKKILENVSEIGYSVSYTTRQIREGEIHGKHYFFVSRNEFEKLIKSGDFLEYAEVHGNYYGTSKKQVESETEAGRDIILEIDVQGAETVRKKMPESVSIFILPPSFRILRERLINRGTENKEELELRLRNSFDEVKHCEKFEYIVVNEDSIKAAGDLQTIILAERLKMIRQIDVIRVILDSFDSL